MDYKVERRYVTEYIQHVEWEYFAKSMDRIALFLNSELKKGDVILFSAFIGKEMHLLIKRSVGEASNFIDLTEDDIEWVSNASGRVGVKIKGQYFFMRSTL